MASRFRNSNTGSWSTASTMAIASLSSSSASAAARSGASSRRPTTSDSIVAFTTTTPASSSRAASFSTCRPMRPCRICRWAPFQKTLSDPKIHSWKLVRSLSACTLWLRVASLISRSHIVRSRSITWLSPADAPASISMFPSASIPPFSRALTSRWCNRHSTTGVRYMPGRLCTVRFGGGGAGSAVNAAWSTRSSRSMRANTTSATCE